MPNSKRPKTMWMSFTRVGRSWRKSSKRNLIGSGRETEGDDRIPAFAGIFFHLPQQARFQVVRIGLHFAGGNLFVRRALKAELADAQAVFAHTIRGSHRRTEDTAGHG